MPLNNSESKFPGMAHYIFSPPDLDRPSILYCYIRKNGCSSFKHFMSFLQGAQGFPVGDYRSLSCNDTNRAMQADVRLFVYRDPLSRVLSAFANKFIENTGNKDLFRSVTRLANIDPELVTFEEFAVNYLSIVETRPLQVDPHFIPMECHLMPIRYTHAIPIEKLPEAMEKIVGKDLAKRFYAKPSNSSSKRITHIKDGSGSDGNTPIPELRRRLDLDGSIEVSLAGERSISVILEAYAVDYSLISRISPS